jgi:nucleoid-associated protein YgaU
MGLMSFIKEAGEKLFGGSEAKAAQANVAKAPTPENVAALSKTAGDAIVAYVKSQGLPGDKIDVAFDGVTSRVTVSGQVDDQATKEKILLCCGNVAGVAGVNDMMTVSTPQPEAQFHIVVSGDNLSKIAKKFYGDANKYPVIFEANKPMLTHPDKIYPGQALRIPPL